MFGIGSQELMIILLIALLLFGAQKLPELARGLGQSIKEFKKGTETQPDPTPAAKPAAPPAPAAVGACAACQAALQAEWGHCPRCGAAAPAPTSGVPAA